MIIKLKIIELFRVTGRGTIVTMSMKDNNINEDNVHELQGKEIEYKDSIYLITGFEFARTVSSIKDVVGLQIKQTSNNNVCIIGDIDAFHKSALEYERLYTHNNRLFQVSLDKEARTTTISFFEQDSGDSMDTEKPVLFSQENVVFIYNHNRSRATFKKNNRTHRTTIGVCDFIKKTRQHLER